MSAAWEFAFIGGTVDLSLPTKAAVCTQGNTDHLEKLWNVWKHSFNLI